MSEYRRSICMSAERSLSRNRNLLQRPQTAKVGGNGDSPDALFTRVSIKEADNSNLPLPSYKLFDQNRDEIGSLESQLLKLSKERDAYYSEFDKIQVPRTLKAKQRHEELIREIDRVNMSMAQLKQRMRQLGVYHRE